jgi:nucleoside-diphosphate kinase
MPKNKQLHPAIYDVKYEQTFCMIKPDGVMRGLIGEIIHRIEKAGLKVVAMKMLVPTDEMVRAHYPASDEAWVNRLGVKGMGSFEKLPHIQPKDVLGTEDTMQIGKDVLVALFQYMQSGPVVALVVEGLQAVDMVRKLAGNTLPYKADVGTIRGDFSVDSPVIANSEGRAIHNLFHASETPQEAANEIKLWFGSEVIHDYDLGNDSVMYAKHY